eukprot:13436661-Alexandrium_andersonii.AAC.1
MMPLGHAGGPTQPRQAPTGQPWTARPAARQRRPSAPECGRLGRAAAVAGTLRRSPRSRPGPAPCA